MTTATEQNVPTRKVSRSTLERRELRQQHQRQRLLVAAGTTFAQLGYADTVVVDIIKTAGMSRRSFYEIFTSKENILEELYKEAKAVIAAEHAALLSVGNDAPLLVASNLVQAYLTTVRTYRYVRDPVAATTSQPSNDAYKALVEWMAGRLIDQVQRSQPTGRFAERFTSVPIWFFLNGLSGLAHNRKTLNLDNENEFAAVYVAATTQLQCLFAEGALRA